MMEYANVGNVVAHLQSMEPSVNILWDVIINSIKTHLLFHKLTSVVFAMEQEHRGMNSMRVFFLYFLSQRYLWLKKYRKKTRMEFIL